MALLRRILLVVMLLVINAAGQSTTISAADANMQYIGRFASADNRVDKLFDFAGSEIRLSFELSISANVTIELAQVPHLACLLAVVFTYNRL
jgi:hypothetical protein